MIHSFSCKGTKDIFEGLNSKAARKVLPVVLHHVCRRKLDALDAATSLEDLKGLPGNHLEALSGDLNGWFSIRFNDQYRIVFQWKDGAHEVYACDYH